MMILKLGSNYMIPIRQMKIIYNTWTISIKIQKNNAWIFWYKTYTITNY